MDSALIKQEESKVDRLLRDQVIKSNNSSITKYKENSNPVFNRKIISELNLMINI